jgi:hypothetical protein
MKKSFVKTAQLLYKKIKEYLRSPNHWFLDTPERALLEASQAAQRIKNIEIEHFGGEKISSTSEKYTENVMSYWQVYLEKNLTIIKIRLAEFTLSRKIIDISNSVLLEKLKFIDEVVEKYAIKNKLVNYQTLQIKESEIKKQPDLSNINNIKASSVSEKTGMMPGSIGRTFNLIKRDLSPKGEEKFTQSYRFSRQRTKTVMRFFLILIFVPFLTQYISKEFLVSPISERIRGDNINQIFINSDMEKEALHELGNFQSAIKFEYLINQAPPLSSEAIQEKIKSKAIDISEKFRIKSNSEISNVFADLISLISFILIIIVNQRKIATVKSFIDNIVYGLSDSAKAFLIILSTDIFVGFHSPDGWQVLLKGLSEHLGLPINNSAIFIFIATFPVILNTIFKYWIFSYLSRLSPSALATLKEMDE